MTLNKEKLDIAFVVLHYQTLNDTRECVQSILENIDTEDFLIVIVDNASPNDSGNVLIKEYNNQEHVKVVRNINNLGFANGNNVGIFYLRDIYTIDYIVLLNNDVRLVNNSWKKILYKKYKQYHFHVLGPNIVDIMGNHTANPDERQIHDIKDLKKLILNKKIQYLTNCLYIDSIISFLKQRIKRIIGYKVRYEKAIEHDVLDVQLEGSCLVLSRDYFEYMPGLYDGTFLYFEEAIMRYIADKYSMQIMYTPELTVIHKHGSSTKNDIKSEKKRKQFYLIHSMKSCRYLLNMMEKDINSKRGSNVKKK